MIYYFNKSVRKVRCLLRDNYDCNHSIASPIMKLLLFVSAIWALDIDEKVDMFLYPFHITF